MPERQLIPTIDARLGALLECNRRQVAEQTARAEAGKGRTTITLSREFGCEAYPVAQQLKLIMEKQSGEEWSVMDKGLLDEVAKHHNLSEGILQGLGEKFRFLDEIMATFSPRWKSEKDYFHMICRYSFSLAEKGNCILVGRGGAIITQSLANCFHFRLFASQRFKIRSIAQRLGVPDGEAEAIIQRKQKQRDAFIRDFLDRDAHDLSFYHLIFNNDRNTPERIAGTIADYLRSA